ncbi:hypothetical protein [Streptomyces sp. NBC_01808]|uniref:hypothetical protein n=1 Tax=Streptomyces sp. NBC_01808 TaxID=2975947 RepID=UPI003FA37298
MHPDSVSLNRLVTPRPVWVHGPGREPWEVYVVKGDAERLANDACPDSGSRGAGS